MSSKIVIQVSEAVMNKAKQSDSVAVRKWKLDYDVAVVELLRLRWW